jgi:flagellar hook assembly protein FlgD
VAVYNVLGQRVKTVCNDNRGAGEHQVTWDGRDDRGQPVASGVYFYTVATGSKRLSKSIVLLK